MDARLRRLRFRDLELLVHLDDTRSLRKSAEILCVSQPAVTKALREVESSFGCPLFERSTRRIVPTDVGYLAIDHARSLLGNLDLIDRQLVAKKAGLVGERRIGVIPYAAPALMPHIAKVLMRSLPGIRLVVVEGTTEALIGNLRKGALDIVLARHTAAMDDVVQRSIYREQGAIVVRPGHPLTHAGRIGPDRLEKSAWILPPANSPTRLAIDMALVRAGITVVEDAIETMSVSFLIHLLDGTDMVSVLPRSVASVQQRLGTLRIVPTEIAIDLPDLCLYRRTHAVSDAAIDAIAAQALLSGNAVLSQSGKRRAVGLSKTG